MPKGAKNRARVRLLNRALIVAERRLERAILAQFRALLHDLHASHTPGSLEGVDVSFERFVSSVEATLGIHLFRVAVEGGRLGVFNYMNDQKSVGGLETKADETLFTKVVRVWVKTVAAARSSWLGKRLRRSVSGTTAEEVVKSTNTPQNRTVIRDWSRMEVHDAIETGGLEAAKIYEGPLVKEWHTMEDEDVRPTHQRAHGQIRELNEAYSVGGYPMRYPGDLTAPVRETRHCRCLSLYHPIVNGRIIR